MHTWTEAQVAAHFESGGRDVPPQQRDPVDNEIAPDKLVAYRNFFLRQLGHPSLLSESVMSREVAMKWLSGANLPQHILDAIWNLADVDHDGSTPRTLSCYIPDDPYYAKVTHFYVPCATVLSLDEFCVAAHLAQLCKNGENVPTEVRARFQPRDTPTL